MLNDKEVTKELSDGSFLVVKPFDDCCYKVEITDRHSEVISDGIWCPKSHILALDGKEIGMYSTKEDLVESCDSYLYSEVRYF